MDGFIKKNLSKNLIKNVKLINNVRYIRNCDALKVIARR